MASATPTPGRSAQAKHFNLGSGEHLRKRLVGAQAQSSLTMHVPLPPYGV